MSRSLIALAAAVLRVEQRPERVLEVGCGNGDGALFLAREFPVARVRGVDSSAEAVRAASRRVGLDPEGRIAFKLGGPSALPYPDRFFDLVVRWGSSPRLGETLRVLREGGYLIVLPGRGRSLVARLRFAWLRRLLLRRGFVALEQDEVETEPFWLLRRQGP